jgi:hypothetical protein
LIEAAGGDIVEEEDFVSVSSASAAPESPKVSHAAFAELHERLSSHAHSPPRVMVEAKADEEDKTRRKNFSKKRAAHYNEFLVMQQWREAHSDEEEMDE